jgi:tyrosyl-tRNA synthetase
LNDHEFSDIHPKDCNGGVHAGSGRAHREFLLRLKLADNEDEARQLITSSRFYLNDECFNDPGTVINSKFIKGWTLVKAGERQVWVTSWSDDNGLR